MCGSFHPLQCSLVWCATNLGRFEVTPLAFHARSWEHMLGIIIWFWFLSGKKVRVRSLHRLHLQIEGAGRQCFSDTTSYPQTRISLTVRIMAFVAFETTATTRKNITLVRVTPAGKTATCRTSSVHQWPLVAIVGTRQSVSGRRKKPRRKRPTTRREMRSTLLLDIQPCCGRRGALGGIRV